MIFSYVSGNGFLSFPVLFSVINSLANLKFCLSNDYNETPALASYRLGLKRCRKRIDVRIGNRTGPIKFVERLKLNVHFLKLPAGESIKTDFDALNFDHHFYCSILNEMKLFQKGIT